VSASITARATTVTHGKYWANTRLVMNIEVLGPRIGACRKRRPDLNAACFGELFAPYEEGRPTCPGSTMPIAGWQDALAAIAARTARGRIVLLQDRA
jgi:hypothetical protein